jgi:hypothetical protein
MKIFYHNIRGLSSIEPPCREKEFIVRARVTGRVYGKAVKVVFGCYRYCGLKPRGFAVEVSRP